LQAAPAVPLDARAFFAERNAQRRRRAQSLHCANSLAERRIQARDNAIAPTDQRPDMFVRM
jgi:hypothetical protein